MAAKKRESLLFQRLRKHLKNIHFTRIESSTIQGIPDVHGCSKGCSFWIELKSTDDKFPVLSKFQQAWCFEYARHGGRVFILHQTLLQRAIKLYRVSRVDCSFSFSSFSRFLVLEHTLTDPPSPKEWKVLQSALVKD
jgi:hypothetical protein